MECFVEKIFFQHVKLLLVLLVNIHFIVVTATEYFNNGFSSTENLLLYCEQQTGIRETVTWDLKEGRCVIKESVEEMHNYHTYAKGLPLKKLDYTNFKVLHNYDSCDEWQQKPFLTVSSTCRLHVSFDISKLSSKYTIYNATFSVFSSFWDGKEEQPVALDVGLSKSHPIENPGLATKIAKNTLITTLHVKPLDVESIVNIKNIIQSQQRIINLDQEFSRRATLSQSLNLFLDWHPLINADATYIKLHSTRNAYENHLLSPRINIEYSDETWIAVEPRTIPINRSTSYLINGLFDMNEQYACAVTFVPKLSNITEIIRGSPMLPNSTTTLICEVPKILNEYNKQCNSSNNNGRSPSKNNWARCYETLLFNVYRLYKKIVPVKNSEKFIEESEQFVELNYNGGNFQDQYLAISSPLTKRPAQYNSQLERPGGYAAWNGVDLEYFDKTYDPNDYR
jgi:hypothetical protein